METDTEVVVKQTLGPNARTDWSCANIVAAVKHLARRIPRITWNAVRRNTNSCANSVALQARREMCPVNSNGEKPPESSKRDSELDKLSSLPDLVIERILFYLPIRDAVRTSVLSSEWRFKWTTMRALVFDKDFFSSTPQDQPMKLVNFIDQALLFHAGSIWFNLYQRDPISKTDLDRWILHLSKRRVREIILDIYGVQLYELHSSIYSFQDLFVLDLYRCHLKPPSTFGGFKKLHFLVLHTVTAAQDVLETLISSCPLLRELSLLYVDGLTQLNIDAPNLWKFVFKGNLCDINFINCPYLGKASIKVVHGDDATERFKARVFTNLLKFFSNLSGIKWLVIDGRFLKYLAIGYIPRQLPNPCLDLDYLSLSIYFGDCAEISAALCLLRSSPNIQELEIGVIQPREEEEFTIWESEDKNCSFNELEIVRIGAISGNKNELEFIRIMLLHSPVLQKMTIKSASENQSPQLARELLGFQRASAEAEVVFLESPTESF